ncbi:MAG: O-antigen ligase family protein [Candidatus Moraniibacteriota bacterium]
MSLKKIAEYLFLFFLFLLPFQTVFLLREPFIGGEKWQYGTIGVYAIDILLGVILGLALVRWLQGIKYGTAERVLILLVAWAGLSFFWASDQELALYFFIKLLLVAVAFFFVRSTDIDLKKVVFVLLVAGVIQSSIGVVQFLSQEAVGSSWLGMSTHEAFQAGSSVLKLDSGRFLRAYGTFPHPNMLGGFLGVILVMGSMYYVSGIKYEKSWKCIREIAVMLSGLLVIFLGLLLTFSRTAWLGVVLGIIAIGVGSFWQKEWEVRVRFLKIVVALGVVSLIFGSILFQQIFPRFDTATIEGEGSVTERLQSFQDAKELIVAHPFFGVGAGNFTAEIIQLQSERPAWSIQPAHNVFVLILAELGLVGLLLFVGFLVFSFLPILQSKIVNHDSAILIALLVLIPSLFLDHWLWTSHFGLLFFFFLAGLATRREE